MTTEDVRIDRTGRAAVSEALAPGAAMVLIAVAMAEVIASPDGAMVFHGVIVGLAGVGAAVWLVARRIGGRAGEFEPGYNTAVVRAGVSASIFWGIVGFTAGDFIAWQLVFPALNFDLQ